MAWAAIRKQKLRSFLTILAISLGISAVIVIFAAGEGLRGFVRGELETFGTDTIELEVKVPNTGKTSSENAMGMAQGITITTFRNEDIEAIRKHPNISHIYGAIMGQEVVSFQEEIKKVFLMGVGYEAPIVNNYEIAQGRSFTEEEEKSLATVAVLGHDAWEKLFGDESAVGKSIKIKGKKFRVVGVMEEKGSAFFMNMDDIIYIPVTTMQKRILGIEYLSFAVAKMKDAGQSATTQKELIELMRTQHNITDPDKDDFSVNTMAEAQDMLDGVISGIAVLLVALVCISLVVGGVGIMNIMYVSVAERTFEIGLRKSLGAKRQDILWQFLVEAVIITLGGGIAGIVLGIIGSFLIMLLAINYGLTWSFHISFFSILIAVSFSTAVGILFGLYPARRAANLDPIEALRKE